MVKKLIGIKIVDLDLVRVMKGDKVMMMEGERGVSNERNDEIMEKIGFDSKIWEKYIIYVWKLMKGDLGKYMVKKKNVIVEFLEIFNEKVEL